MTCASLSDDHVKRTQLIGGLLPFPPTQAAHKSSRLLLTLGCRPTDQVVIDLLRLRDSETKRQVAEMDPQSQREVLAEMNARENHHRGAQKQPLAGKSARSSGGSARSSTSSMGGDAYAHRAKAAGRSTIAVTDSQDGGDSATRGSAEAAVQVDGDSHDEEQINPLAVTDPRRPIVKTAAPLLIDATSQPEPDVNPLAVTDPRSAAATRPVVPLRVSFDEGAHMQQQQQQHVVRPRVVSHHCHFVCVSEEEEEEADVRTQSRDQAAVLGPPPLVPSSQPSATQVGKVSKFTALRAELGDADATPAHLHPAGARVAVSHSPVLCFTS